MKALKYKKGVKRPGISCMFFIIHAESLQPEIPETWNLEPGTNC